MVIPGSALTHVAVMLMCLINPPVGWTGCNATTRDALQAHDLAQGICAAYGLLLTMLHSVLV